MVASLSVQGQQDPQAVNKPDAYLQKIVADGFVDTALQQNGGDAKKLIQDMQDGLQDAHKKGEMSVGVLATMKIILDDAQKSDDPAGALKKGLAEQMEYLVQEQKKQEEQAKARLDQTERERLARETAQKPQEHSAKPNEPQGELQQKIMEKLSAAFEGGKFDLQVLFSVMKEVMQTVVEEGQKKMAEAKQKAGTPEGPTTYSDPKTTAATNGQPAPEGQRADRFNGMAQDTSQTTAQRVDPKVEVPAAAPVSPAANDPVLKVAGMSA